MVYDLIHEMLVYDYRQLLCILSCCSISQALSVLKLLALDLSGENQRLSLLPHWSLSGLLNDTLGILDTAQAPESRHGLSSAIRIVSRWMLMSLQMVLVLSTSVLGSP